MNELKWIEKNCSDLTGKTILIVGSTGGIAKYFTWFLAKLNANFVFANRNIEKTNNQINELKKDFPNIKIKVLPVDMFDTISVKKLCENLKSIQIDIVVLNAAIYNVPRTKSSLGYDNVFQVNFVSPYFLIKQLLPLLEKQPDSKVIAIGSIAHNYSKINEKDIDFSLNKKCNKVYGNSKRFLMFSMSKLFENKKTKLSIVHPGITLTNMTNHYPKAINWLVKIGVKLLFPTPKKASLSVVYGTATSTNKNEWIGPSVLNIYGKPKKKKLSTCSIDEQNKIYEIAEKIYSKINKKDTD